MTSLQTEHQFDFIVVGAGSSGCAVANRLSEDGKHRAVATRRTLRSMLTKPGWNHLEVRTLRGVLSALEREPRD